MDSMDTIARLDALDAEIDTLGASIREVMRISNDLVGGEPEWQRTMDQLAQLEWLLAQSEERSRRLNRAYRHCACSLHRGQLRVTCDECCIAWRHTPARVA